MIEFERPEAPNLSQNVGRISKYRNYMKGILEQDPRDQKKTSHLI